MSHRLVAFVGIAISCGACSSSSNTSTCAAGTQGATSDASPNGACIATASNTGTTGGTGSTGATGTTGATDEGGATAGTTGTASTTDGIATTGSATTGTNSSTGSSDGGLGDNGCFPDTALDRTTDTSVTITFGGDAGLTYDPPCVKVRSGTSVTFTGDFLVHPLGGGIATGDQPVTDTTSPIKQMVEGSTVTYVIAPAGTYPFFCYEHSFAGMYGAIYATP